MINLGTAEDEKEEEVVQEVDVATLPIQKGKEGIDTQAIQDRILTLKLMFQDNQKLREDRQILNATGKGVADDNLDLISKFNVESKPVSVAPEQIGRGVSHPHSEGNTRMISSII